MAGAARHIPAAPGGSQGCRRAEGKRSRTARRLAGNNILESTGDLARGIGSPPACSAPHCRRRMPGWAPRRLDDVSRSKSRRCRRSTSTRPGRKEVGVGDIRIRDRGPMRGGRRPRARRCRWLPRTAAQSSRRPGILSVPAITGPSAGPSPREASALARPRRPLASLPIRPSERQASDWPRRSTCRSDRSTPAPELPRSRRAARDASP